MTKLAIIPNSEGNYISLSRSQQGRIFKKHILSVGELLYPGVKGGKVDIDENFLNQVKDNFNGTAVPIVQFPLAGAKNEHSEDPSRNLGQVVDLSVENGKMYAHIDVRKHTEDIGSTILGASAMLSLNYTDTSTGQKIGPALLHVAATNRPYVTSLDDYEEIVAASVDSTDEEAVILTTSPNKKEEVVMTLAEILAALKADHNIDVEGLQAQLEELKTNLTETEAKATESETSVTEVKTELETSQAEVERVIAEAEAAKAEAAEAQTEATTAKEAAVALSAAILEKLDGFDVISLSNAEAGPTAEELIAGVAELANSRVELSNQLETITAEGIKKDAQHRIEGLISEGRILEKNKEAQTKLLLSNSELFEELLPEQPLIELSGQGHGFEKIETGHDVEIEAELKRIAENGAKYGVNIA